MEFIYGKNDWADLSRGQENCYLLTNGLGGYSSMTMLGSVTRNDHALLMAGMHPPNHRYHMLTETEETVWLGKKQISLSSQEYVNHTKNQKGFHRLNQFRVSVVPTWIYQVEGVEIKKTVVLQQDSNLLGICYEIDNCMDQQVSLEVTPLLQFVEKGERISAGQTFEVTKEKIISNGLELYYKTNGVLSCFETRYLQDLYFAHDARDGRDCVGQAACNHSLCYTVEAHGKMKFYLLYGTEPVEVTFEEILENEISRLKHILQKSEITDKIGRRLVISADQFLAKRESTDTMTIIAGYPFFGDWGRDTMIALSGCCFATKRYKEAKEILRTFIKYCRKGLMPNMFPEGGKDPLYNTVDASLLFILAVYEYYMESEDLQFVQEAYPTMQEIISWYQKGTDYHIRMEGDGLISAGEALEQVTWMDIRFEDILPTPRHGKPVEINAYWYNSLRIMQYFCELFKTDGTQYGQLADKARESFRRLFWNEAKGCLRDVISGGACDEQLRCNQIWAVSLPFALLTKEQEKKVVDKVYEKLYTPYGLRSLEKEDPAFHPNYTGSLYERDMAYHQGTVWGFPLGGYYQAYLKVNKYSSEAVTKVREELSVMEACMREGCIGQLAEVFDGDNPVKSCGCFAQAWSVGEILKIYALLEKKERK
jgi:predicted glycogen debranching enzyme